MSVRGQTIDGILADSKLHAEIISTLGSRIQASSEYYQPRWDAMIRAFKIYRAIVDATDDSDEPNTGPCYAFGIIEDAVASISESILNSRVPTPARAKRAGDEKAAENLNAIAASYFATGQYQSDYPNSVRERLVAGANWEADCWAWRYRPGKRWSKETQVDADGVRFDATIEVDTQEPVQVGYYTRFPCIFNMFPQPRQISVEKMKYLIEIEERVALSDLEEMQYIDPVTNEKKPFFNLDAIKATKAQGGSIRPTEIEQLKKNHRDALRAITDGVSEGESRSSPDDTDELMIAWMWEPDCMYAIANNKWVIAYVENLYHRPGIPYRLKNCTQQSNSLYGLGLIEPVESLFGELDDIHKLSMRNWVRIINKMIAYNMDDVPFAANDFKPRAGGKIRVRPSLGGAISGSIMGIDQPDVSRSMLTMESNDKGLLERALGLPDFSAGVEGTKQSHSTLGGLDKISAQAAKRVASIRRQELAGFQKQMWRMEGMYSQFLVEKMPFAAYGPDGTTVMQEFDLWDISTDGRGLDFIIEYDPAFGDDALMRNQMMVLLDEGIKYNDAQIRLSQPGEMKPLVVLEEIMRKLLRTFGFNDTSKVLAMPNGVLSPQMELQLMLQGKPVQPNPLENLVDHYSEHTRQYNDPQFQEAVARGAVPPDVIIRLKTHIAMTGQMIQAALMDPSKIIRAKEFASSGGQPGGPGPVPPAPTGDSRQAGITNFSARVPSA